MKIAQIFENDIDEARRGNWGREQSHATGQQLGKDIASGLPSADQQAAIKTGQAQAAQGQAQADLQARLAQQKAQNAAAPAAKASPLSDEEREAHKAAGGKFDPQTGAAIPLEPAAQQATSTQQTDQAPAAKPSLGSKVAGAAQKVGDVGSAVTGAIGNIGAGFFGGMKRGFHQQAYGAGPARPSGDATMAAARQQSAGGTPNFQQSYGGEPDVAALSARVDALEKALQQRGAVAESFTFYSNFLGKDI